MGGHARTPGLTRREFLKLGAALTVPVLLEACSPDDGEQAFDWQAWWRARRETGTVDFANWPYYIDRRKDDSHPSLDLFTRTTGIDVNYYRPIRDNAEFLAQIAPDLAAGRPIGYDIVVITNGPEFSELVARDWLTPLDHSRLPNFRRWASPLVRDPIWDPDNQYSLAWQSGLTGIAYRPEAVEALGRRPTSVTDLFDPALTGRVGMFRDLLDLGSTGLLAGGVDPAASTPGEWRTAASLLTQQRDAGLVRTYYDQGYLRAIQRGETWISQAWSGDIFQINQLGDREVEFVVPDEGAILWTDNMVIPRGSQHPLDALQLMNFVYDPEVAALIADWVWYLCPVPRAQGIVANEIGDGRVAHSPLVFPTEQDLGPSIPLPDNDAIYPDSPYKDYPRLDSAAARDEWHRTFGAVIA
jgi:spermidine/putrescine transport system substrate-binding protein